jgi:hypothetical protein
VTETPPSELARFPESSLAGEPIQKDVEFFD